MIYATPDDDTIAVVTGVPDSATLGVKVTDAAGDEVIERTTDVEELIADSGIWVFEFDAPEDTGSYRVIWDAVGGDPSFATEDLEVTVDPPLGRAPGVVFNAALDNAPSGLAGTLGVRILEADGTVITARTTDDIVEVEDDSGIYAAPELLAPEESGHYIVVWDADGVYAAEVLTVDVPLPWRPSVADVAKELRARTRAGESEAGTFNADTRPTATQVEGHIDEAVEDVLALFASGEVPDSSYGAARRLTILKAAMTCEASYQPEQAEDAPDTLYRHLSRMHDAALGRLVTGAQVRDLFGEADS